MFSPGLFIPGAMLSSLGLFMAMFLVLSAGPEPAAAITSSLQSILRNTHGSKDYGYPTDLTRDLLPVCMPCQVHPSFHVQWRGLDALTSFLDSRSLA